MSPAERTKKIDQSASPEHREINADNRNRTSLHPIIPALEGRQIYDPEGPMTVYLRDRVDLLRGDDYPSLPVYVAQGDEFNAFATDAGIVVFDGVLKRAVAQEQIDALLGHEYQHVERGHVCAENDQISDALSRVGRSRTQEVEADLRTIELLDKRGINPLGLVSMFDVIQNEEEALSASQRRHRKDAPTHSVAHGSTLDRRITAEQALTVIDVKHLSPELHALPALETGAIITPDSASFHALPPILRQAVLNNSAATTSSYSRVKFERQKQIIKDLRNEAGDDATLELQAALAIEAAEGKGNLAAILRNKDHIYSFDEALSAINSPELTTLVAAPNLMRVGARIANRVVNHALFDPARSINELRRLAGTLREHNINHFTINTDQLFETYRRSTVEQRSVFTEKVADFCADTHLDPYSFFKMLQQSAKTPEEHAYTRTLYHQFEDKRNETITSINDPVKELLYSSKCLKLENRQLKDNMMEFDSASRRTEVRMTALDSRLLAMPLETVLRSFADHLTKTNDRGTVYTAAERLQRAFSHTREGEPTKNPYDASQDELVINLMKTNYSNALFDDFHEDLFKGAHETNLRLRTTATMQRIQRITAACRFVNTIHSDLSDYSEEYLFNQEGVQDCLGVEALSDALNDNYEPLITLLQKGVLRRINSGNFYNDPSLLKSGEEKWNTLTSRLLENPALATDEQLMLAFAALGKLAPDIEININTTDLMFEKIAKQRDFEGGIRLITEEFPLLTSAHPHVLSVLMEEKARTPAEFERLEEIVEEKYAEALTNNMDIIGKASLLDALLVPMYASHSDVERRMGHKTDIIEGLDNSELLAGLLSTGNSDERLKIYLAKRWWLMKRTELGRDEENYDKLRSHFVVEDYLFKRQPNKRSQLAHWLQHDYPESGTYTAFESQGENVYLLSRPARFLATRKLLLEGERAVLKDEAGMADLVDALMGSWLQSAEGSEESKVTRSLIFNLMRKNETTATYQHVAPMIEDMILKPPHETSDLRITTDAIADQLTNQMITSKRMRSPTELDFQAIRERVYKLFTANQKATKKETSSTLKHQVLDMVGAIETDHSSRKMSTIAFSALAGKKSGALGVKMLQLAGQYFDLSEADRAEFEEVYDDMKGQTRLQAYRVFKREAANDPYTSKLFNSIKEFGPRIGGGSLFTVYNVTLKDGRDIALGVKNPNAEYRVAKLADFTATGLDATLHEHKDNKTLQLMATLLNDAATWVKDELHDADFDHKDSVFKAENDTRRGNSFSKGSARYDLVAPETHRVESQWIRAEELVLGKNLTGLEIVTDQPSSIPDGIIHQDDFKQVASVITRSYVNQVLHGTYAHSDIHPGNFRVTPDNASIAVFDRHNLIPVTSDLRGAIRTAFQSLVTGDNQAAALSLANYACGPDGMNIELQQKITEVTTAHTSDPAAMIVETLIGLKKEGISVPLNLSLLLRNFMSVTQLSQQAGFNGIVDSFVHTADENEIARIFS